MCADIARAEPDSPSRCKVHHARQVVDQVTLLRERVKRQEKAIETVIAERDKAVECCEKQKQLIEQLQQKLNGRRMLARESNDADIDIDSIDVLADVLAIGAPNEDVSRGSNFSRNVSGKSTQRVSSMRAALLRIGGVEVPVAAEDIDYSKDDDAFDASEFQPIMDEQGTLETCRQLLASSISRVASVASAKRDVANLDSDGLQASR